MAVHINDEMLNKMDAYWRAANYLAAGQLYLLDNPLLKAAEARASRRKLSATGARCPVRT